MSAFFSKPKISAPQRLQSPQTLDTAPSSPAKQVASSSTSDFDKVFKPFAVKKDAVIAPVNLFIEKKKAKEIIVLDGGPGHKIASVLPCLQDCKRDDLSTQGMFFSATYDVYLYLTYG